MISIGDYHQPSVFIDGIRIDEPVTSITDILVSVVCFYSFFKLKGPSEDDLVRTVRYYFRRYFLLMGLSTFYGGCIGHAFLYMLSFSWKLPGWLLSMISMNFLERAMIEYAKHYLAPTFGRFLTILNIVELFVFSIITIITQKFYFVEIHAAYGLLCIVLPFSVYLYFKTSEKDAPKRFLYATFVMMIASIVFRNRLGISEWFNHNDIAHVLMCFAGGFFYLGVKHVKRLT